MAGSTRAVSLKYVPACLLGWPWPPGPGVHGVHRYAPFAFLHDTSLTETALGGRVCSPSLRESRTGTQTETGGELCWPAQCLAQIRGSALCFLVFNFSSF